MQKYNSSRLFSTEIFFQISFARTLWVFSEILILGNFYRFFGIRFFITVRCLFNINKNQGENIQYIYCHVIGNKILDLNHIVSLKTQKKVGDKHDALLAKKLKLLPNITSILA